MKKKIFCTSNILSNISLQIDNVDSSVTLTSNDKTQHSENTSNKSWEQRLASPSKNFLIETTGKLMKQNYK